MPKISDETRSEGALVQLKLRFAERVRSRVETAAKERGNSLNAEIVDRLERSLADDGLLGGSATKLQLVELGAQVARGEALTGKRWRDDPTTFGAVRELVLRWLNERRPLARNAAAIGKAKEALSASEAKVRGALIALEQAGVIQKSSTGSMTREIRQPWIRHLGAAAQYKQQPPHLASAYSTIPPLSPAPGVTQDDVEQLHLLQRCVSPWGYELAVDTLDPMKWAAPVKPAELTVLRGYLDILPAWTETVDNDRTIFLEAWAEDEAEVKAGVALVQPQDAPEG